MSTKARALPAGWSKVLDDVHARLDQAIASANARVDAMPPSNGAAMAPERRHEIAQWTERLDRLGSFMASAEQVVQSVDELLQSEEARLQDQLTTCKTLRQKAG